MNLMSELLQAPEGKRKRGRPPGKVNQDRWMAARGINPLIASEVLAQCVDERKAWARVLASEDDRVLLSALTFLVQMRDGKPSQSISVTSTNVNLNARDIETARTIVREIRGDAPLSPQPLPVTPQHHQLSDSNDSPLPADVIPTTELV